MPQVNLHVSTAPTVNGQQLGILWKTQQFYSFFAFPIKIESQSCINTSAACFTHISWAMGGGTRDTTMSIGSILPFRPFPVSRSLAASIFFN